MRRSLLTSLELAKVSQDLAQLQLLIYLFYFEQYLVRYPGKRGWFEWGPFSLSPRGRTSLVSLPTYRSFTLGTGQLVNPCEIAF